MDGVQLPQGYGHFEEAVYFLPLSSQKFLVLILSTSEGWKAELTLEPPSGFELGTLGLGIQRLNHFIKTWIMYVREGPVFFTKLIELQIHWKIWRNKLKIETLC